jgi:type II secretory pathway pseudopilin PulG
MTPRNAGRRQRGFTYLGLIVLVTVIGLVGAATLKIDSLLRRAAAEEELLAIGAQFSAALTSYAAATPKGQSPLPPSLQELLKDPRTPAVRRHLRKIFIDPVTGGTEWGIVYQGDRVGVLGVHSLSKAAPLKIGNFDARFAGFENKQHLSDWKFMSAVPLGMPPPVSAVAAVTPLFAPAPQPEVQAPPQAEPPEEKTEAIPPAATDER